MALPVINVPTYEVPVPSTKDKITFRPFLVKEEKILLLALEDGGDEAIARAIKQIIHNCTFEKVDVDSLATFDLEFVFLRIRAKSVGEIAKVQVLCEDDGETFVEAEVPLEEIEVNFPKGHTNNIKFQLANKQALRCISCKNHISLRDIESYKLSYIIY